MPRSTRWNAECARRIAVEFLVAWLAAGGTGCTTARRATDLVVEHHVGMARSAVDLVTGEAEAREERLAKLRSDLEASRQALETERDPTRRVTLLEQRVALQDALIAELEAMPGHAHQGGGQTATGGEEQSGHAH